MVQDNRQASDLIEGGILGAGECLAERFDCLARKLIEVEKRFDNRLVSPEIFKIEKYLNGRFAVVGHLRMGSTYSCYATAYLRPAKVDHGPVVGFDNRVITQLGDGEGGDKHVVLLPVAQVVEVGQAHIPPGLEIVVRFDPVYEKVYDVSEGFTFKSLRNDCFYALRIGANWKGVLRRIRVKRAHQTHPAKVGAGPQIVADVSDQTWNSVGNMFSEIDLKKIALAIRIGFKPYGIRFSIDESCDLDVEVVDQLVGPYSF